MHPEIELSASGAIPYLRSTNPNYYITTHLPPQNLAHTDLHE
jgi:hypothetical protein